MNILISNQQNQLKIPRQKVLKAVQAILNDLDCPEGELSVLIVDNPRIAELNQQYLHREGPTNVIAFPMREGEFSDINPHLLGDVVISAQRAVQEAKEAGVSTEERFLFLLIHGILHLFGYDHEKTAAEAAIMEAKTDELMKRLKIAY